LAKKKPWRAQVDAFQGPEGKKWTGAISKGQKRHEEAEGRGKQRKGKEERERNTNGNMGRRGHEGREANHPNGGAETKRKAGQAHNAGKDPAKASKVESREEYKKGRGTEIAQATKQIRNKRTKEGKGKTNKRANKKCRGEEIQEKSVARNRRDTNKQKLLMEFRGLRQVLFPKRGLH
jgi:hypothetical protein